MSMRAERTGDPRAGRAEKRRRIAIGEVINAESPVDLSPQNAYVRRLQHMLAQRYNLSSRAWARNPPHVRILRAPSLSSPRERWP